MLRYETLRDVAPRGGRHPRATRDGRTQGADAVPRDVPHVGERMAGDGAADVQAIDAEESSAHVEKHLVPRFGDKAISDITRQDVQAYVAYLTQAGYAPKTVDHIHDVLSAVLRTAVKWGHMQENPARGVDLPALKTVRPKWVLTAPQAALLLAELPPLPRAMAGVAMLTGLRRGELFALRWIGELRRKTPDRSGGGL